jgi:Cu(I)/Ag(I) efflux system periplasmic protein CusF
MRQFHTHLIANGPLILALACALSNCSTHRNGNVSGPAAAVQTTTYNSVGVVKSTNLARPSIELNHEDIKGLMPAMTMEFYVKDKSLLDNVRAGDRVAFTIENGVGGLKITAIRKL